MICQRCRSNLLSRLHLQHVSKYPSLVLSPNLRRYSSLPKTMTPPSPQSGLQSISIPSAIVSFPPEAPQISQPINTPAPVQSSVDSEDPTNPVVKRDSSSCFAGTRLLGLNYMKNKPDVVALEDSDYPHWLWGLLDGSEKQSNSVSGGVDISKMTKKERKRHGKKMALLAKSQPRKIPLHEQSIDITPAPYNLPEGKTNGDITQAVESLGQRSKITKSARAARRKSIKESNFLRGL